MTYGCARHLDEQARAKTPSLLNQSALAASQVLSSINQQRLAFQAYSSKLQRLAGRAKAVLGDADLAARAHEGLSRRKYRAWLRRWWGAGSCPESLNVELSALEELPTTEPTSHFPTGTLSAPPPLPTGPTCLVTTLNTAPGAPPMARATLRANT